METILKHRETSPGTWDEEHVKALLHFPRFPIRLIQQEPWQSWIGQRGGLKAIYDYLQIYPLTPSHRRILEVVLSSPESVADVYADRLNISRATYFYQLRELVPALVQALNQWELNPFPQHSQPQQSPFQNYTSLPNPLTTLVGVEEVLNSLIHLFQRDDVRLLSLLGIGGVGKTRLSIELAKRLSEQYGSDLSFIDLSSLRDYTEVAEFISKEVGVNKGGVLSLKAYLHNRKFLLILDNFEHLLAARDLVTDLLASAPRLKILVTSRTALHIYGEQEFIVRPLPLPAIESTKDPEMCAQSPAVMLFVQRAHAVNPGLEMNRENMEAMAELCLRMEGIPLAIELAAFQVKYFSPQALLVRLSNDRQLDFLSHVPKRLPPHQQNMRAMLDWSYDLLAPELQILFRRLSVFSGGFSIGAVAAICSSAPPVDTDITSIQAGLTALADQSMLEQRIGSDGEPRFHLLGITCEYALELLIKHNEIESLRRFHAQHYLQLIENIKATSSNNMAHGYKDLQKQINLSISGQSGFATLQAEYTNIISALQWTIDMSEGEIGLRFIIALWDYWKCPNNLQEGRQYALSVLEQTSDLHLSIRAQVLRMTGWLAHDLRDTTTMRWAFQAASDLSESLHNQSDVGLALHGLGELARLNSQFQMAKELIEQSRELFDENDNKKHIAWSRDLLGYIDLSQGNLPAAQNHFQASLNTFRRLNHSSGLILSLLHLGQSLYYQGLIQRATLYLDECLSLCQAINKVGGSAYALALNFQAEIAAKMFKMKLAHELNNRARELSIVSGYNWCLEFSSFTAGLLMLQDGEMEKAACCIRESLLLQQSLKEVWRSLTLLEATAELTVARQDGLAAARLFGATQALRDTKGIPQMDLYRQSTDSSLEILRKQIDVAALDDAWLAGQDLSLDQAMAYAIRCLE